MNRLRLAAQLGWSTLRSRPTLTILAIGLLAIGMAVLAGVYGTIFLLRNLQSQFLTAMTVELELVVDSDSARTIVMTRCESWPDVEFVRYVTPDEVLREIQKETGENLLEIFGVNPFPALVRIRFARTDLQTLDRLTKEAGEWPEVGNVVYPRTLWSDLQRLATRIQGRFGWGSAIFALVLVGLVGLCLRAQIRNLRPSWEFLGLLGMSRQVFGLSLLVQESIIGFLAGLVACGLIAFLANLYSFLLLRNVAFPIWFYFSVILTSVVLAIIAGFFSPREMTT